MTDRWHLRLLLATALIGPGGNAQNSAELPRAFDLTGTVYDSVTNAPVAHALVQIAGQPYPAAFTGEDGRFEIKHVRSGPAYLEAEKPGYFSPQSLSEGAPPPSVTVSETISDVRLKLIPEAHIEGRITNTDNEPIAGIAVSVTGEQIADGWKRRISAGSASTNAAGRFRVDGLKPGRYYLSTASREMFLSAPADSGVNLGYAQQYYPAAPDSNWSQAIELKAAETVQVNMELPAARSYQISGTVSGFSGEGAMVSLSNESGDVSAHGIDAKTGDFKIYSVFPGTWKLVSWSGPSMYGEQSVRVIDADVAGVRIDMHPSVNIPLEIDSPPAAQVQPNSNLGMPQVWLNSTDRDVSLARYAPQFDSSRPNESALFTGVRPGPYHVTVVLPPGMCVQSISSGNKDLATGPLVVQDGIAPQPIHVVLGNACAKLTGTVTTDDEHSTGRVVLLPVSAPASPAILAINSDRSFAAQDLSPGDYRIFAATDLAGLEYANPQALATIPVTEIHLDANQTTSVNLQLYRREQP